MSYAIENRHAITNSMTPAAAAAYYKRPRTIDELVDHWWGLPQNRAKTPDGLYQYMINAGKSVNFILGWDDYQGRVRILAMTPLDRVAITTQNANIFSISVETDPLITTTDPRAYELYKALGWLHFAMEQRYGKRLRAGIHFQYWQTQCSPIDKNRVLREAEKWRSGGYNPTPPTPPPVVEGAVIKYTRLYPTNAPRIYRFRRAAGLYNFNHKRHADMERVLPYNQGDTISIVGMAHNQTVNSKYLMTAYSFGNADQIGQPKFTNGVNEVDLELIETTNPPAVEPPQPPAPLPPPTPAPKPDVKYALIENGPRYFRPKIDQITLWDFNYAKHIEMKPVGFVKKDTPEPINIVAIAKHPTGSEYYMTAFSYDNSGAAPIPFKTTGFNKIDLEEVDKPATPVPTLPPVEPAKPQPIPPSENSQAADLSWIKRALEAILRALNIKV